MHSLVTLGTLLAITAGVQSQAIASHRSGGQFYQPAGVVSTRYCGENTLHSHDLCCDGNFFSNPQKLYACCGSGYYDIGQYGCDGYTTFLLRGSYPGQSIMQKVYQRVLPMNYYCGHNFYDPKEEYCCGCCTNEEKVVLRKGDTTKLCCWGFTFSNEDGNQACCGEKSYDTRFYTCTAGQEVIPRKAPLIPFTPSEFCSGKQFNPETHYCCGVRVVELSSKDLCCDGFHYVNPEGAHLSCCCSNVFDTRSQMCETCTVAPLPRPGPTPLDYCGSAEYNPESQFCCGTALVPRGSNNFLCCNGVYYTETDENLQCCHTNMYDKRSYRCHGRAIIKLLPPTMDIIRNVRLPRYCGGVVPGEVRRREDLCCKGIFYPNRGNLACCGQSAFDTHHQHCAPNNVITQVPIGMHHLGRLPLNVLAQRGFEHYVAPPVSYILPGQKPVSSRVAVVSAHRNGYGSATYDVVRPDFNGGDVADGVHHSPAQPVRRSSFISRVAGTQNPGYFVPEQQQMYLGNPNLIPGRPSRAERGSVQLEPAYVSVTRLERPYPTLVDRPDQKVMTLPQAPIPNLGPTCADTTYDPLKEFCCGDHIHFQRHDVSQICCNDVYHENKDKDLDVVCCGERAVLRGYDVNCH